MRSLFAVFIFLLSGCSIHQYEHSEPKIITIKTPQLRYSDLGYVKHTQSALALELYVAGKMVQKIEINHLICVDEGCMSKGNFNAEYLSSHYPDDILQHIILARPIYDGKVLIQTKDGFEQKIVNSEVDIVYRVTPHDVYFKDKKNHILFKIKDTHSWQNL